MASTIKNDLSLKYSRGTILIHWISLFLILVLIPTGFIMANTKPDQTKLLLLKVHLLVGMTVFILTLVRVWFFVRHKRPAHLQTGSVFHDKLVVWVDNSFYVVLLLLALSGIATIITGGLGETITTGVDSRLPDRLNVPPLAAHQFLAKLLIALLLAHVFGVINHYLKFRENTLKRILP